MTTILQIMNADRNLSLFSKGIKSSALENRLGEPGPFTILGPVNLALGKLVSLSYDQLLEPRNREKLVALLSGYILSEKRMLHDFRHNQTLTTLGGKQLAVSLINGGTFINGARILSHNRQGANGVVHLLDKTYAESSAPVEN